jgi:CRISPR-associated protein Cas2
MVWDATNEQGYQIQTAGKNRREPVDWLGLQLVAFLPQPEPGSAVQVGSRKKG